MPVMIFSIVAIPETASRMFTRIISDDRKQVKLKGVADGGIPISKK